MSVIRTTSGRTGAVAAILLFTGGLTARADEVLRWNRLATEVSAAAQTDPLTESRAFAIVHAAVHDALNATSRGFAGIHFRTAVRAGFEQGEAVGAWTYEHALRPVAAAEARAAGGRR